MSHLRIVLQVLKYHKIFTMFSKYNFFLRSISFLGHIMLSVAIDVDPKKMEAVHNSSFVEDFFRVSHLFLLH